MSHLTISTIHQTLFKATNIEQHNRIIYCRETLAFRLQIIKLINSIICMLIIKIQLKILGILTLLEAKSSKLINSNRRKFLHHQYHLTNKTIVKKFKALIFTRNRLDISNSALGYIVTRIK